MKISVALCTYNGALYLSQQLASIAGQTRLPDELVICDDDSTDETIAILESFARSAVFPVHIHRNEKNLGSTKNFEQAIKLCQHEIIALADQDDVWYPDKLALLELALSSSSDTGAVFSDADVVDENLKPTGQTLWQSIRFNRHEQRMVAHGNALNVLLKHHVVTGATMAFRAHYKDVILPIPENWVHDGWIALLVAILSNLVIIKKPLIKYRQHPRSQIGTPVGMLDHLFGVREAGLDVFSNRFQQYEAVYDRLSGITDLPHREKVLIQLQAKINHTRVRATAPESKIDRISALLKELMMLRYHRYSSGIYSFLKDLLLSWQA